jgi:hypothetical protein
MKAITHGSAILALLAVVAGCGSAPEGPRRLALSDLADFPKRYDGQVVITQGMARTHDEPEHYWIEDEDLNRVRITPQSAIERHVGKRVRVKGAYRYAPDKGRWIEAERVVVSES